MYKILANKAFIEKILLVKMVPKIIEVIYSGMFPFNITNKSK